jgi:peptide/histidine transporter 3/4
LVWTEENVGWGLGYGISALFIGIAIIIFFLGTPIYRVQMPRGSPLTRICQVISAALFKRKLEVPQDNCLLFEIGVANSSTERSSRLEHSDGLRLSHSFKHIFISNYTVLVFFFLMHCLLNIHNVYRNIWRR